MSKKSGRVLCSGCGRVLEDRFDGHRTPQRHEQSQIDSASGLAKGRQTHRFTRPRTDLHDCTYQIADGRIGFYCTKCHKDHFDPPNFLDRLYAERERGRDLQLLASDRHPRPRGSD